MANNNGYFRDLMDQLDGEERFDLFSDMVSMILAGHWRDRLTLDGVSAEDGEEFEQAVCKYLRNIRLRNHADRYLRPLKNGV